METDVKKNLGTYREKHACGLINGVNLLITQTLIEQRRCHHIFTLSMQHKKMTIIKILVYQ